MEPDKVELVSRIHDYITSTMSIDSCAWSLLVSLPMCQGLLAWRMTSDSSTQSHSHRRSLDAPLATCACDRLITK
jgi:hypothetical protein